MKEPKMDNVNWKNEGRKQAKKIINIIRSKFMISVDVTSNLSLKFVFGYEEQKQALLDKLNELTPVKHTNLVDALLANEFMPDTLSWRLKPLFNKLDSIDDKDEFYKIIAPFAFNGKIVYLTEYNEVIVYNFINNNLMVTTYIEKD